MLSELKNITQNRITPWSELIRSKEHFKICNTTLVSQYNINPHPKICKIQVIPKRKNIFNTVLCLGFVLFFSLFLAVKSLDFVSLDADVVGIKGISLDLKDNIRIRILIHILKLITRYVNNHEITIIYLSKRLRFWLAQSPHKRFRTNRIYKVTFKINATPVGMNW